MFITIIMSLIFQNLQTVWNQPFFDVKADEYALILNQLPENEMREYKNEPKKIVRGESESLGVKISAQSAIVVDVASGKVLFSKNSENKGSIASMTKLMTALVFLENNPGWDKKAVLSQADETHANSPNIYRGEAVSIKDLFFTSLIASDNNAVKALVRATGLTEDEFVSRMNKKAEQYQLNNTKFTDPTGLDNGNVSNVFDVSKLTYHALSRDIIRESTSLRNYSIKILNSNKSRTISSTDSLLSSYINKDYKILGGKTGFIDEAGYCLTIEVDDNSGNKIIIVVMNSASSNARFQDAKALTQWTFENYAWE